MLPTPTEHAPDPTQPASTDVPPTATPVPTNTPLPPALPEGMVLAHAIVPAEAGQWRVVVCVANFGARPATDVRVKVSWADIYRLIALQQHDGRSDLSATTANIIVGDLTAGAQTQLTLLLAANADDAITPTIRADLTYSDGPARADNTFVDCRPDGIGLAVGAGTVKNVANANTPTASATPTSTSAIAQGSVQRAAEPPSLVEPPTIELAAASWQCFILPALLLGIAAALLVLRSSRRQVV
jgi:hypothetical protein